MKNDSANDKKEYKMKNRLKLLAALALWAVFGFSTVNLFAQEDETSETTETSETEEDDLDDYDIIMEDMKGLTLTVTEDTPNVVTREEMDREGAKDLFEALRNVPGVIQSGGGARNDSSFMIRGFDSASMPIYVDGVTQADPYRGDADAARILSGDIESIQIEKGFSSMLLGANTMGGAIIVRTAKPKSPFEASVQDILGLDSMAKFANNTSIVSAGTKQRLFYAKGTFQYRGIDHYRLSADFEPVKYSHQGKGDRLWSNSNDMKLTMIAGWTPVNNLDLCVSWIYEDSYKGFSPPAVNPSDGKDYQIWEWPRYDKQTVTFAGEWTPYPFEFEFNGFFTKFNNSLIDYYSWANYEYGLFSAHEDYDDWTAGFRMIAGFDINSWNKIQAAVNFREDEHKGIELDRDMENYVLGLEVNEDTWSLGAEYTCEPSKKWRLVAGIGWDAVMPNKFWGLENDENKANGQQYIEKTQSWRLLAMEGGVYWTPHVLHTLHFTYARKNHFPTMSQRYSGGYDETRKPNPYLGPEFADHFELGYKGTLFSMFKLNIAGYFSSIAGKIIENKYKTNKNITYYKYENIDNTAMWGLELGLEFEPVTEFLLGGTFSLNKYSILHSELDVKVLTYYPEITSNVYIVAKPDEKLSVIPSCSYTGSRYADADAETLIDGYFLFNLKATWTFNKYFSASLSVDNIFDTLYEIRAYFPMQGRSYSITVNTKY